MPFKNIVQILIKKSIIDPVWRGTIHIDSILFEPQAFSDRLRGQGRSASAQSSACSLEGGSQAKRMFVEMLSSRFNGADKRIKGHLERLLGMGQRVYCSPIRNVELQFLQQFPLSSIRFGLSSRSIFPPETPISNGKLIRAPPLNCQNEIASLDDGTRHVDLFFRFFSQLITLSGFYATTGMGCATSSQECIVFAGHYRLMKTICRHPCRHSGRL